MQRQDTQFTACILSIHCCVMLMERIHLSLLTSFSCSGQASHPKGRFTVHMSKHSPYIHVSLQHVFWMQKCAPLGKKKISVRETGFTVFLFVSFSFFLSLTGLHVNTGSISTFLIRHGQGLLSAVSQQRGTIQKQKNQNKQIQLSTMCKQLKQIFIKTDNKNYSKTWYLHTTSKTKTH